MFAFRSASLALRLVSKTPTLSQPIKCKTKINLTYSQYVFPRLTQIIHVFSSNPDWLIALFASVVIGQSNYFGFD